MKDMAQTADDILKNLDLTAAASWPRQQHFRRMGMGCREPCRPTWNDTSRGGMGQQQQFQQEHSCIKEDWQW